MIPFLDLGAAYHELKPKIDAAVSRVLESGWYILGPEVEAFESEWAAYCEAKHAVGLANGLDALTLALRHSISDLAMKSSCPPVPILPHGSQLLA